MRTSNITKLQTCGCGLQELRSCELAVADFKNYKVADLRLRMQESQKVVADLRLRIQESQKVVADLRLRTKLLNVQLRTCGCGLRKLKFGYGFADCGLKKNLRCPELAEMAMIVITVNVKLKFNLVQLNAQTLQSRKTQLVFALQFPTTQLMFS